MTPNVPNLIDKTSTTLTTWRGTNKKTEKIDIGIGEINRRDLGADLAAAALIHGQASFAVRWDGLAALRAHFLLDKRNQTQHQL